ncbi:MAG: hypothetical protein WAM81_06360 [Acidimicrobiia bacterium]
MRRRLTRPQLMVVLTICLLAAASVLQWLSPPWYDANVGSLVLGVLTMLLFLTLTAVLFDVFWPMDEHARRR